MAAGGARCGVSIGNQPLRPIARVPQAMLCSESEKQGTEVTMSLSRRPLYQRNEGADEDVWRLAFDTDSNRLFVEHEKKRGDMRGAGYTTSIEEIDLAVFLGERGPGQQELTRLLKGLFEDRQGAERVFGDAAA